MTKPMSRMAVVVLTITLAFGPVTASAESEHQRRAMEAAKTWLELVDSARFDDSWEAAAGSFKTMVKKEQWREMAAAVRGPLGSVVSREFLSAEYRTTLPGAPDGEYVVIQFATSFEHKKSAVETVTPVRDRDGTWRVSGYFVR